MVDLVRDHIQQLQTLCDTYRVGKLWVFGSAVNSDRFHEDSDLDFLYEFDVTEEYDPTFPYAANWSDLLDRLRELFHREVQLIPYGDFRNPYFKESVDRTKILIYDKNGEKVAV